MAAMVFGCCVPAESALLAAEMGYDYVEIPAADLHPSGTSAEFGTTARAIQAAGIPATAVNWLVPAALPIVGPSVDLPSLQRYMSVVAERAAALGSRVFVLGSGAARRVPDGFSMAMAGDQFRTFARLAAEASDRHGIAVAIEPINRIETNFLHRFDEAVQEARAIEHAAVGVLADSYHMHMEGEPFWHLLGAGSLLRHVQVCDAGRAYPGSGGIDLLGFFVYLNAVGYSGTVSVECCWRSFRAEGPTALDFVRTARTATGEPGFAL